jgi:xanthine dehydrogenase iron-sulfur cluster and FAD-binding subunit A
VPCLLHAENDLAVTCFFCAFASSDVPKTDFILGFRIPRMREDRVWRGFTLAERLKEELSIVIVRKEAYSGVINHDLDDLAVVVANKCYMDLLRAFV